MVEQWTENPCVPSSSLGLGTLESPNILARLSQRCDQSENDQRPARKRFSGPDSAVDGGSSNGRTTVFGTVNRGSNPCPPASFGVDHPPPRLNTFGDPNRRWSTKYGAYSSKAERLIVDQKVAGSSPARRPFVRLCLALWRVWGTAELHSGFRRSNSRKDYSFQSGILLSSRRLRDYGPFIQELPDLQYVENYISRQWQIAVIASKAFNVAVLLKLLLVGLQLSYLLTNADLSVFE